jgi:thiopurine S-methyltransferase
LDSDFWHRRWRKNEIAFHQESGNPHLREFWEKLGLTGRRHVFVPLCGKSRDMIWLARQGHMVLGVEISAIAVRDFFREHDWLAEHSSAGAFERWESSGIRLLCGDFFALQPSDLSGVDAVYDRASLIALPPPLRARYAEHLRAILPPTTPVLLVTLEYPQQLMQGPPFSVHEEEIHALYGGRYAIQRLKTHNALADNPRFQNRGLPHLLEKVFFLTPL